GAGDRRLGITGLAHVVAARTKGRSEAAPEDLVVVDDEETRTNLAGHNGTSTKAEVPAPGLDSIRRAPPILSTTFWARKRPRPIPLPAGLVVKKGSTARAVTSSAMPVSRSITARRIVVASTQATSSTGTSGGEASMALSTRFVSAWTKASGGTRIARSGASIRQLRRAARCDPRALRSCATISAIERATTS